VNLAQAIDPATRRLRLEATREHGSSGFSLAELIARGLAQARVHTAGADYEAERRARRRDAGIRAAAERPAHRPMPRSQPRARAGRPSPCRDRVLAAIARAGRRLDWNELQAAAGVTRNIIVQMVGAGLLDRTGARRHYRYGPKGMR
jgi:hypothetical protein